MHSNIYSANVFTLLLAIIVNDSEFRYNNGSEDDLTFCNNIKFSCTLANVIENDINAIDCIINVLLLLP